MEKPNRNLVSKITKVFTMGRRKKPQYEKDHHPQYGVNVSAGEASGSPRTSSGSNESYSRRQTPLPPPPPVDAINKLQYYHPQLTNKEDVQNFMTPYSLQEGYFIIRNSFKEPHSYTITVSHRTGLKHVRFVTHEGRFLLKDRNFETVDEMIQFYSHREIPNEEDISGILLKFPIRRPPIEFGEYILVSNQTNESISKPTTDRTPRPFHSRGSGEVGDRPPAPPPPRNNSDLATQPPPQEVNFAKNLGSDVAFCQTGNPYLTEIKSSNRQVNQSGSINEKCDCGLVMREAALPDGWSVHISQDPDTKGQVFFISPDEDTHWSLPMNICLLLSLDQQNLIRTLGIDSGTEISALASSQANKPRSCTIRRNMAPLDVSYEDSKQSSTCTTESTSTWVSCNDYESSPSSKLTNST